MKILSISNVCLVGVLILGVWAAWSATGPQRISGNQVGAGRCGCTWKDNLACTKLPFRTCTLKYSGCQNGDYDGYCMGLKDQLTCKGDITNCLKRGDEVCIGD
jgi:hypothetical protein